MVVGVRHDSGLAAGKGKAAKALGVFGLSVCKDSPEKEKTFHSGWLEDGHNAVSMDIACV